eukprot:s1528_g7.t1
MLDPAHPETVRPARKVFKHEGWRGLCLTVLSFFRSALLSRWPWNDSVLACILHELSKGRTAPYGVQRSSRANMVCSPDERKSMDIARGVSCVEEKVAGGTDFQD